MNFAATFEEQMTVVGAGTMGEGIAEIFLRHGWQVNLLDTSPEQLSRAQQSLKGRLGTSALKLLSPTVDGNEIVSRGFIVESVPEDIKLKIDVISGLEKRYSPRLLCTNTSSLSISEIQAALRTPQRFLGLHFFQPVPETKLIEVVHGSQTDTPTLQAAIECAELLQRKPIVVKDSPGFATSRLGVAIGLEAMRMLEEGVASAEDIDAGMRLGYKHEVGPLRMTDIVGLDVRLAISEYLAQTLGDRFGPPEILREMVASGRVGRKAGQGFFEWDIEP